MNDDLLDALGRSLRDDLEADVGSSSAELDDPWLAPIAGEEQDELLEGMFARLDAGQSLEPLAALEALDEPEALDAELGAPQESEPVPAPRAAEPPAPVDATPADEGGAKVIDLRARIGIGLGAMLAAAAALALIWFNTGGPSEQPVVASIPSYATSALRGGLEAQRGEAESSDETLELESGRERIDWVLTPAAPVREALEVALLATPEGGGEPAYRPDVVAQISDAGAVRLRGPLSEFIELGPGSWSLTLLIGPDGALPRDALAAREAGDWQRATIRVTIRATP